MGYFLNKFGISPIKEAEVDGEDLGDDTQDYTSSEDNANTPPQENQEQDTQQQDDINTEEQPADDTTTDYTEMDGEEMEGDQQDTPPEEAPPEDNQQPVDDIKQQEEELIGLNPDQLDIRHEELKRQFLAMYDMVVSIIERIDDASIDNDSIKIIEYISDTLTKLKTRITDYVNNVYSSKSYIENSVNYGRFLAVLNGVQKILEEMNKNNDK